MHLKYNKSINQTDKVFEERNIGYLHVSPLKSRDMYILFNLYTIFKLGSININSPYMIDPFFHSFVWYAVVSNDETKSDIQSCV